MSNIVNKITDPFRQSTDETYNHPLTGAGGFGMPGHGTDNNTVGGSSHHDANTLGGGSSSNPLSGSSHHGSNPLGGSSDHGSNTLGSNTLGDSSHHGSNPLGGSSEHGSNTHGSNILGGSSEHGSNTHGSNILGGSSHHGDSNVLNGSSHRDGSNALGGSTGPTGLATNLIGGLGDGTNFNRPSTHNTQDGGFSAASSRREGYEGPQEHGRAFSHEDKAAGTAATGLHSLTGSHGTTGSHTAHHDSSSRREGYEGPQEHNRAFTSGTQPSGHSSLADRSTQSQGTAEVLQSYGGQTSGDNTHRGAVGAAGAAAAGAGLAHGAHSSSAHHDSSSRREGYEGPQEHNRAFTSGTQPSGTHTSLGDRSTHGQTAGAAAAGAGLAHGAHSSSAHHDSSSRREGYEGPQEHNRAFTSGTQPSGTHTSLGDRSTHGQTTGDNSHRGAGLAAGAGAAGLGAGIAHNIGGDNNRSYNQDITNSGTPSSGLSGQTGSGFDGTSHSGAASSGLAGIGAGSAGTSHGQSNSGLDSVNVPKPSEKLSTGNPTIDQNADKAANMAQKKIEENTDKDGFTNLTGDKQPGGGLTGRAKVDTQNPEESVVETTKERSKRDSQGRELDSYGKPYEF